MTIKKSLQEEVAIIAQSFLRKLEESIFFFEGFLESLEYDEFEILQYNEVMSRIHKIAGAAEVFGFERLGDIAIDIENEIKEKPPQEEILNLKDDLKFFLREARAVVQKNLKIEQSDSNTQHAMEYKCNILVVEDNDLMRDLIVRFLRDEGCLTYEARDGEEALKMVNLLEKNLDLIVLDVNMPRKNGFEVLKTIKEDQNHKKIPVIMLTRRVTDADVNKGMSYGVLDYIAKPFKIEDLINRIIGVLNNEANKDSTSDEDLKIA